MSKKKLSEQLNKKDHEIATQVTPKEGNDEVAQLIEYQTIYDEAFSTLNKHGPEALILMVNSLYLELCKTHDAPYYIIEDILDTANLAIIEHNKSVKNGEEPTSLITCDILPSEEQIQKAEIYPAPQGIS